MAAICMRYARRSKLAIRASRASSSGPRDSRWRRFSSVNKSKLPSLIRAGSRSRSWIFSDQVFDLAAPEHRYKGPLMGHTPGKKAARQFETSATGKPGHIAMKPGRFWFSVPRP